MFDIISCCIGCIIGFISYSLFSLMCELADYYKQKRKYYDMKNKEKKL